MQTSSRRRVVWSALPVLLSLGVYGNTLQNGFVWDDPVIVERQLPAFSDCRSLFWPPADLEFAGTYYRPLIFATYLFDNWLGGGAPWAFHLTPLVAHALVTLLVFGLGRQLGLGYASAAAAAVLFAAHPIHTESVAWMAGRSDVLACLFLLAAMLPLARGREPLGTIAIAALLLAAMLSKETAVIAAPIVVIGAASLAPRASRRAWVGLGLAVAVYGPLRLSAGALAPRAPAHALDLPSLMAFVGFYVAKLAMPVDLNALTVEPRPVALYVALSGVALGVGGWSMYCSRRDPRVRFLLCWIGITLVPAVLPILWPVPAAPFAERYAYLPSVGGCVLSVYLAARWIERRSWRTAMACFGGGVLILGLSGWATFQRNAVWRDDLSFWSATAARNPRRWLPLMELGRAYEARGQTAAAEAAYRGALTGVDSVGLPLVLNNLGSLLRQTGRENEAEASLRRAAAAKLDYPDPLYNLGVLYWDRGKMALDRGDIRQADAAFLEARRFLEAALQLSPRLSPAHYALGSLGLMTGDFALAQTHLQATMQLTPHSPEADFARQVWAQLPAAMRQHSTR